jgi:hypothetical protein
MEWFVLTVKKLFWSWLIILFILNVIPLGTQTNESLSGNRFIFRLDYLIHATAFKGFAWIYLFNKVRYKSSFESKEIYFYSFVILGASIIFELIQLGIPYRSFNPWDMLSNLVGAIIGIGITVISNRLPIS